MVARGLGQARAGCQLPRLAAMRAPVNGWDRQHDSPQPKPWIAAIHAYVPGKSAGRRRAPAGQALGQREPARHQRRRRWRRAPRLRRRRAIPIPTATALRAALGALHGIDPARIVCGTGSDELLHLAAQRLCRAGRRGDLRPLRLLGLRHRRAARAARRRSMAPDTRLRHRRRRAARAASPSGRAWSSSPIRTTRPAASCRAASSRGSMPALPADVLLVLDQAYAEYRRARRTTTAGWSWPRRTRMCSSRAPSRRSTASPASAIGWGYRRARADRGAATASAGRSTSRIAGQAAALAALGDQDFVDALARAQRAPSAPGSPPRSTRSATSACAPVPSEANFVLVLFEGELTAEAALRRADGARLHRPLAARPGPAARRCASPSAPRSRWTRSPRRCARWRRPR